ncbi:MAG: helix-turn-helix transcriptional regulator [Bacteroidales bacterium]|nr:helix-turn-helix transcriptional regulator [Bacteroidales bacterium]
MKVVLAERKKTNLWLAAELGVNPSIVSKWCSNSSQPDIFTFRRVCQLLDTPMDEIFRD